jgi:hypothetical protein
MTEQFGRWLIRGFDKGLPRYYTARRRLVKSPVRAMQFQTYSEALAWAQEFGMGEWIKHAITVVPAEAAGLLRKNRLRKP